MEVSVSSLMLLLVTRLLGRPLPEVYWIVDGRKVEGKTQIEPGKDVVVNRLRYSV